MPMSSSAKLTSRRATSPRSIGPRSKYEPRSLVAVVAPPVGDCSNRKNSSSAPAWTLKPSVVASSTARRAARAAFKRRAIRVAHVAHEARFQRRSGDFGEDRKRRRVGRQAHVRFFMAHEAFDARAVEHDPAVERRFEFGQRDRDVLGDAMDVGELQAYEADAA